MKKTLLRLSALLSCGAALCAPNLEIANTPSEARLHLPDRTQELRTTSVNWPDLVKSARSQTPKAPKKRVLRILLDAGHGGKDLGATPGLNPLIEKDLTLRVTELVRKALERYSRLNDFPLEVQLSRSEDEFVALRERVRVANDWPADLFVSLHANSSNYARARGFEVYFINEGETEERPRVASLDNHAGLPPSVISILNDEQQTVHVNESSLFAESIFQAMSLSVRPHRRGVHQAPFTVLHGTQMPAVLIEMGYLTNKDDATKLTKAPYLKRLAGAISSGIVEFATHLHKKI